MGGVVLFAQAVDAPSLAGGAGAAFRDTGLAVIGALLPLAVALILARAVIKQVRTMLGFNDQMGDKFRDEYWTAGDRRTGQGREYWDVDSGRFVGTKKGRGYYREVGSRRRRYDR